MGAFVNHQQPLHAAVQRWRRDAAAHRRRAVGRKVLRADAVGLAIGELERHASVVDGRGDRIEAPAIDRQGGAGGREREANTVRLLAAEQIDHLLSTHG